MEVDHIIEQLSVLADDAWVESDKDGDESMYFRGKASGFDSAIRKLEDFKGQIITARHTKEIDDGQE